MQMLENHTLRNIFLKLGLGDDFPLIGYAYLDIFS